jgi:hypothetical protein
MKSCFHKIALHKRAISCLLIPAFLLLALFPFHYHLHHLTDGDAHDSVDQRHVTDLHALTAIGDVDHHKDSHIIDPTSHATFKMSGLQLPLFILAFTLLALLQPGTQRIRYSLQSPSCSFAHQPRYSTPPLRAPPRA